MMENNKKDDVVASASEAPLSHNSAAAPSDENDNIKE